MIEEKKVTKITSIHRRYDANELHRLLKLPKGAKLFIQVPGGCDWSHAELELGVETNLESSFEKKEESK